MKKWALRGAVILSLFSGVASAQTARALTGLIYTPAASRQNGGDRNIEATLLRYFRIARGVQRRSNTLVEMRNRHISREDFNGNDDVDTWRISSTLGRVAIDRAFPNVLPNSDINGIVDRKRLDLIQICTAGYPGERFSGITRTGAPMTAINGGVLDLIPVISAHEWGHSMNAFHDQARSFSSGGTVMREGSIRFYTGPEFVFRGDVLGDATHNNARQVRDARFRTSRNR